MFGCAIALRTRWRQFISIGTTRAPAVCSTTLDAVEALDRPAVELPQQVADVGGDDVDERRRRRRAPPAR